MYGINRAVLLFLLSIILLVTSGCSSGYMQNRGKDALDILDVGVVINKNKDPQFGLYFDFFNILPLGYSHVKATAYGIGNRHAGKQDFIHNSWGVIAWGEEQKGSGTFNPYDPHQGGPEQASLTERPVYNAGIPRLITEDNSPPVLQFFECDRIIYLGWIGMYMTVRPLDIVDFLLGWTTIDIMGDDGSNMN